jgi:Co/Zn/Cd efflux system component
MNSYKRLYLIGFSFFLLIGLIISSMVTVFIFRRKPENIQDSVVTMKRTPDTIYTEKIIEKKVIDTVKVYIPAPKPVQKTTLDTTKKVVSEISNESPS